MNPDKYVQFYNDTLSNYISASLTSQPPYYAMKDLDCVLASLDRIGATARFLKMRLTNPGDKDITMNMEEIKSELTKLFRNYVIILSNFSIPINDVLSSDIPKNSQ